MRSLSGHDAGLLDTDTAQVNANANVSLLHLHDQSTAPGGLLRFKRILAQIERRLAGWPLFRQRLQRLPAGLDPRTGWTTAAVCSIPAHPGHGRLRAPGHREVRRGAQLGWRQAAAVVRTGRRHAGGT